MLSLARGFELETSNMEVPSSNHWATPMGKEISTLLAELQQFTRLEVGNDAKIDFGLTYGLVMSY